MLALAMEGPKGSSSPTRFDVAWARVVLPVATRDLVLQRDRVAVVEARGHMDGDPEDTLAIADADARG